MSETIKTLCLTWEFKIVDETGKEYSLEEAKKLWEDETFKRCNMAFYRLSFERPCGFEWDIKELKKHYQDEFIEYYEYRYEGSGKNRNKLVFIKDKLVFCDTNL